MPAPPIHLAERFVAAINAHDVDQLLALMTAEHRLVDSLGNVLTGRDQMRRAWQGYFAMVPDYRITVERVFSDGNEVLLCGVAGGTFAPPDSSSSRRSWRPSRCERRSKATGSQNGAYTPITSRFAR
jgi:ketosteroid isomerase-like protein